MQNTAGAPTQSSRQLAVQRFTDVTQWSTAFLYFAIVFAHYAPQKAIEMLSYASSMLLAASGMDGKTFIATMWPLKESLMEKGYKIGQERHGPVHRMFLRC